MIDQLSQVRQGRLFVPWVTVQRGKQKVVLLGMIHFAHQYFFTAVFSRLRLYERAGFRVLYEDMHTMVEPITPRDHHIKRKRIRARVALKKEIQKLQLVYQPDVLVPQSSWISADYGPSEIQQYEISYYTTEKNNLRALSLLRADPLEGIIGAIWLGRKENWPDHLKMKSPILLQNRDELAVRKTLKYVEQSPVVTYWGISHLPGITSRLRGAGFEHKQTEWIPAVDLFKLRKKSQ